MTRLYPGDSAGPLAALAFDAGWEVTGTAARRKAVTDSSLYRTDATMFPNQAGSGVVNDDTLTCQLQYGPIAAQVIGGAGHTIKGQNLARESNALTDGRAQVLAKVVSADGLTVRGTLLAMDAAALSSEFPVDTSIRSNRQFPRGGAQALAAVQAVDGDYVVIEYGFRNHNTNTSAVVIRGALDSTPPTSDLPEDETTVGSPATQRSWFEFDQTIALYLPRMMPAIFDIGIATL